MKAAQIKEFVDQAPIGVSDISFAVDADEFAELQYDTQQFYYPNMVVLNINSDKITIFKKR